MKRSHATLVAAAALLGLVAATVVHAQSPKVVKIKGTDAMKYDVVKIDAKPGEQIKVQLTAVSSMPKAEMSHNFVLLAKGTNVDAFANASAVAQAAGYIAPAFAAKVLASTKLAGNGDTVQVTFDAPKTPGRYDYLCSFPGHSLGGMRGVLIVK